MNIQLSENQQISFFSFLEWATKEEPLNYSEWGEDYINICQIKNLVKEYIFENTLNISEDEFWSLHSYLSCYVDEIFRNKLGENIFTEYRDLFIHFHNFSGSKYPFSIFIVTGYESQQETIVVNPLENPDVYLR